MRNLSRLGVGLALFLSLMACGGPAATEVRHMPIGGTAYIAAFDSEGEGTIELMPDGRTVVISLGADTVPVADADHPVEVVRTAAGFQITDMGSAVLGVESNNCIEDGSVPVDLRVPLESLPREQAGPESGPDSDCLSQLDGF